MFLHALLLLKVPGFAHKTCVFHPSCLRDAVISALRVSLDKTLGQQLPQVLVQSKNTGVHEDRLILAERASSIHHQLEDSQPDPILACQRHLRPWFGKFPRGQRVGYSIAQLPIAAALDGNATDNSQGIVRLNGGTMIYVCSRVITLVYHTSI